MDNIQKQAHLEMLGWRLKKIREKRGIKRLKLAAEMDSSLTSITAWERGERNIQSETIRRLSQALELSYEEEIYWLGLAGHLPSTQMPRKQQIVNVLEYYYDEIHSLNVPAHIIDYRYTVWAVNPATVDFAMSRERVIDLMRNGLSSLDFIFDRRMGFVTRVSPVETLIGRQRQQARRIMQRCLHRRHEPFYQDIPERMRARLSAEDYANFITIWENVNDVDLDNTPLSPHEDDELYVNYDFTYPDGRVRRVQLRTEYIRAFGDLFQVVFFFPLDQEDPNHFPVRTQEGVKLWDLMDVGKFLKDYDSS